jgi:hypothetical protein
MMEQVSEMLAVHKHQVLRILTLFVSKARLSASHPILDFYCELISLYYE